MKGRALALCLGLCLVAAMPGFALATGTVDRSCEDAQLGLLGPGNFAEVFTVGITGQLTGADLQLKTTGTTGTVVASIQNGDASGGYGAAMAQRSMGVRGTSWNWVHFEFSTPVNVQKGLLLALSFTLPTTVEIAVGGGCDAGWATGPSVTNQQDFDFRTYVAAPAQATPTPTPTPTLAPTPTPTPTPQAAAPKATPADPGQVTATGTPASQGPATAAGTPAADASGSTGPTASGAAGSAASGALIAVASLGSTSSANPLAAAAPISQSGSGGSADLLVPILLGIILILVACLIGVLGFVLGLRRQPRS